MIFINIYLFVVSALASCCSLLRYDVPWLGTQRSIHHVINVLVNVFCVHVKILPKGLEVQFLVPI